ncbi:hypothetical protein CB1_001341001 [Camelus ferus]|nr:hypothetical protein CB1_001341001 [Camelus ferus]
MMTSSNCHKAPGYLTLGDGKLLNNLLSMNHSGTDITWIACPQLQLELWKLTEVSGTLLAGKTKDNEDNATVKEQTVHLPPRDSWEQTVPEGLSQPDPVPADALQSLAPSMNCLSQLESGSTAQHRSSSWGAPLAGVQPYSLHTLEDLYHTQGYPTPAPYPFTSFMTMSNDPPPKVGPFSPDEGADTSALQDPSPWTKEDGSLTWGAYECRRAY